MIFRLAKLDKDELVKLMHMVRTRGLEGHRGTWEQFLKVYDPKYGHLFTCPSFRGPADSINFLFTLNKKEYVQLLTAWLASPSRALRHLYSKKLSHKEETVVERLVRMTLTRADLPLEYYLTLHNNPEDWVVTGVRRNHCKRGEGFEMISLSCDMVLCEDGSEAPIRVVALDRDFKMILNEYVKPNQPVSDLRTDITGLTSQILDDATFLSVTDVQEILRPLVCTETTVVGHGLNKVLTALKIDHARVIDTSLVFDYSGSLTLEKPSLNDLCKSILGYDMSSPSNSVFSCLDNAVVAMKLVLSVVEKGAETSIEPTEEMLRDASSERQKREDCSAVVDQCSRDGEGQFNRERRVPFIVKTLSSCSASRPETLSESAMIFRLAAKLDKDELVKLMHMVRTRGLEGHKGTWEQFLKVHNPEYGHLFTCPSFRGPADSINFLTTLNKEEDVQLLTAWLASPNRRRRHLYSMKLSHYEETVVQMLRDASSKRQKRGDGSAVVDQCSRDGEGQFNRERRVLKITVIPKAGQTSRILR